MHNMYNDSVVMLKLWQNSFVMIIIAKLIKSFSKSCPQTVDFLLLVIDELQLFPFWSFRIYFRPFDKWKKKITNMNCGFQFIGKEHSPQSMAWFLKRLFYTIGLLRLLYYKSKVIDFEVTIIAHNNSSFQVRW